MDKEATAPQTLRRPSGGGAVAGIGADFKTNLNTGVGSYSVPINLPSGHRAQSPQLGLTYSSGSGQSEFGLGWGLFTIAIRRDTRNGFPRYSGDDVFLLNGEELAPIGDGLYRPLVDTTFQRVRRLEIGWEVTDRQGTRFLLGTDDASQERHPARPGEDGVLTWFMDQTIDTSGNATRYSYLRDGARLYLERIEYAIYRLEISYDVRPDILSVRRNGFEQRTSLRATRLAIHKTTLDNTLVRTYDLEYTEDPLAGHSLLAQITLTGFLFEPVPQVETAPPLKFEYSLFNPAAARTLTSFRAADGEGPPGLGSPTVDLIDLEGFGLPGVLEANAFVHRYWPNRGQGIWGFPRRLAEFPNGASLEDDRIRFGDMDGDGRADMLVSAGALSGFYPGESGVTWGGFRAYLTNRPTFDARDQHVRMLDANADGRVDALAANGNGFLLYEGKGADGWADRPTPVPLRRKDPTFPYVNFADPRVRLADMTGDGLTDIVRLFAHHLEYWPSLGVARWDNRQVVPLPGEGPARFDPARCHLADINGDGLADLIYVDDDAVYVWVNQQGRNMSEAVRVRYPPPAVPATIRLTDMLGTGTAGLLFGLNSQAGHRDPYRFLDFTAGLKPYLLRRIDNGVGKSTEVSYGSSSEHRVRDRDDSNDWGTFLPRAVQVVNRVHQVDLATGRDATTEYRYHNGQYDGRTQRFAGFGIVDVIESHGPRTMPVRTRSYFHLGLPGEEAGVPPANSAALRGLLYRKETFGEDGTLSSAQPYQRESTVWTVSTVAHAIDGRQVLFPHEATRNVDRFERTPEAIRLITELEHDDFGNVLRERRRGISPSPGTAELTVTIEGTFINDTDRWLLGLPTRRTLISNGTRLEDTRMYYDEQPFGTSTEGLLTRRERLGFTQSLLNEVFAGTQLPQLEDLGYHAITRNNSDNEFWFDEYNVSHDARGNVVRHRDPFGEETVIAYDAALQLFPVRITNPAGHIHLAEYHPRLDTVTGLTDANGSKTQYEYSPLGRVLREIKPGDTALLPTVEYEYRTDQVPISTVMTRRRIIGEAATRRSVAYYDGAGNTIETRGLLDDGTFFVSRRQIRDLRGLVLEVFPAFISPREEFDGNEGLAEARSYRYTFDAMRRATEVIDPLDQVARSLFTPTAITFFDTQDNDPTSPFVDTPRIQTIDAFGRLIRVEESTRTSSVVTAYEYDSTGQLSRIVDASGSELLNQRFDFVGRKIQVTHRDAGLRRFLNDARGKLSFFIDGLGRTVRYEFDSIGRKHRVFEDGSVVERYAYDAGAGANLVGQLAAVEDSAGSQNFSYDQRGLVRTTRRFVAGVADPFEYQFSYDADDRPIRVTHPDGGVTETNYDALGRPASVSGLIDAIEYDDEGRRKRVTYSSGLIETRTYEAGLGRLQEHTLFDPAVGSELFHQRFTYDSAGNVTDIMDARPGGPGVDLNSRSFEYDALNRMVRAQAGGASPFDHHHTYDDIGNMTQNPAFRPEPLSYSGTRLTGFIGGGGPEEIFLYDNNGSMRSRPGMTLEYTSRSLLSRCRRDDGTVIDFSYDYAARRIRKRVTSGGDVRNTIYIGEGFERRPDGTTLRFVSDPDGGAILVVRNGDSTRALYRDFIGNVVLARATDGNTSAIEYLAYGDRVNPGNEDGEILFSGKRLDPEIGLYYFRMRYYDPVLGRFISPDPIALAAAEHGRLRPLSLNPYVYALDNPLRFNDVNGLWTFWEGFLTVLIVAAVVVATALTFGAAGVIALGVGAVVGGLIGGLTTGSVDGALAGAMLGFSIVATVLGCIYLGGLAGGLFNATAFGSNVGALIGGFQAGLMAAGLIPSVRQSDAYKDLLGYASWFNPWAWPGHIVGGVIFIINAIVYAVAYAVTWGDPPKWADMSVSFEDGAVVTEGGLIRPGRAWTFGNFIGLNPNDAGVQNPTDRALILRHERGHALNNAYFGILQVGRIGAGDQTESFWEQLAESNTNPNKDVTATDKDERRRQGGRGFGDVPWWNP
jgi:RHS repeat-associated protein